MVLEKINHPNDIKKIDKEEKKVLAYEIRKFLVEKVSKNGGHLASNLGVVELTIALHSLMDFPEDKLIWDVGHQSYVHKILTGRKDRFDELRCTDGLCGFPKISESDCDAFDTGHSTTSISAGLGIVKAMELNKENHKVVAVIGDGSLTGGMAYEAFNNAASLKRNFTIILNDNHMSISRNVGGMSKYLSSIRTARPYLGLKENVENVLASIPTFGDRLVNRVRTTKNGIKALFVPGMFFEDMGIKYFGPIDGHDLKALNQTLLEAFSVEGPVLVHVVTKKGKGYVPAEKQPGKFHGVGPFDVKTGELISNGNGIKYTDVFANEIVKIARNNPKVVAITAAMADGTGLAKFKREFPNRFFDVGIAEAHGVTFAGGLSVGGLIPVFAVYSSFLQRGFDQIITDVALTNRHVVFAIDRAGIVGQDGETHQGDFDLSYLNLIPNLTIMAPRNAKELETMLDFAVNKVDGPVAIRYPRGEASKVLPNFNSEIKLGKAEVIAKGADVAIISFGNMFDRALNVCKLLEDEGISATLVNARFLKPLDEDTIVNIGRTHKLVVTLEENVKTGGFGEAVVCALSKNQVNVSTEVISIPDAFVPHGKVDELNKKLGLDTESILHRIMSAKISE
ncbi:MAG: 1-deoxy-D-xylulose-5-phosphate synthase [Lachnospiraceae bacterium]|nr:1-deoxy-D-xylulose-5-phosphate synthase [Lachnospiraceae bacterium]